MLVDLWVNPLERVKTGRKELAFVVEAKYGGIRMTNLPLDGRKS